MVIDEESYRFQGAFHAEKRVSEIFLRWTLCREEGKQDGTQKTSIMRVVVVF